MIGASRSLTSSAHALTLFAACCNPTVVTDPEAIGGGPDTASAPCQMPPTRHALFSFMKTFLSRDGH